MAETKKQKRNTKKKAKNITKTIRYATQAKEARPEKEKVVSPLAGLVVKKDIDKLSVLKTATDKAAGTIGVRKKAKEQMAKATRLSGHRRRGSRKVLKKDGDNTITQKVVLRKFGTKVKAKECTIGTECTIGVKLASRQRKKV